MSSEIQVDVTRAGVAESSHQVLAVVSDRLGNLEVWGDPERATIARSAIKSIQAMPLVTSGAADAFELSDQELALACASHSAEPDQVEAVRTWLARIGLSENDLECGADEPIGVEPRRELIRAGVPFGRIHNCCSGKHAGFLSVAVHNGWPTGGYLDPRSAVQKAVFAAVNAFVGCDVREAPTGIDGCGSPVFAIPAWRLALAMARLADPVDLSVEYAEAATRIVPAAQLAYWVSGPRRTEVIVSEAAKEPVVIKGGAEAVYMVALPNRGLGVLIKALDGSSRAAEAAVGALLTQMDVIASDGVETPLLNKAGVVSGYTKVTIPAPDQRRER